MRFVDEAPSLARRARRLRLPQPVDRLVPHLRDRALPIGDDYDVELDEAVPATLVVRGNLRVRPQRITGARRGHVTDRAADVDPRTELHVVLERRIGKAERERGMGVA